MKPIPAIAGALLALAFCEPSLAAQPRPAAADNLPVWLQAADSGDFGPLRRALTRVRSPAERTLIKARIAAGRGLAIHRRADLLRLTWATNAAHRRAALDMVGSSAFAHGDYSAAATSTRALAALLRGGGGDAASVERTLEVAELLRGQPPQQVDGAPAPRFLPLRSDEVGLPRITIVVNGRDEEAVVDTGANLTVLSAETARRLGVTALETEARVGNSVQGTVAVRVGVADRLAIAGIVVRNVPVLVIADSELTFPQAGGYRITSIIGLPVLRALGRIRMDADSFAIETPQPFDAARQNLFANNNDFYLAARVGGHDVPLFLDTGANQTALGAGFAEAHPHIVRSLVTGDRRSGGAGGQQILRAARWTNQMFTAAGRSVLLQAISIELPAAGARSRHMGVIGADTLRRFESHTIDFSAMRLELGAPRPSPAAG